MGTTTTDLQALSSTAAEGQPTPTSPLVAGNWFETDGRPCLLRMEVPVAAREMVAALYGEYKRLFPIDLQEDDDVWTHVAVVLYQPGLDQIEKLTDTLLEQEQAGTLAAPDWLAHCRRRVAKVIGERWGTAKHRCPCGYATDDSTAFDAHLDRTENMRPEHFEVLDGWTLERVLGWHEPGGSDVRLNGHGAAATGETESGKVPARTSGTSAVVPATAPLRRRVTDVPVENVDWFLKHAWADLSMAEELARAELTAQRDGYVILWAHPWVCQIRQPDDNDEGGLVTSVDGVILDGTPSTDPRARQVEQQLLQEAGLWSDGDTGKLPNSERYDGEQRIRRRYASYHVFWEHVWICQLFEPDGTTLIAESDGLSLDPNTDPRARAFAAHLLVEAGV